MVHSGVSISADSLAGPLSKWKLVLGPSMCTKTKPTNNREREREGGGREGERERENSNSNSKTLFYKDCSLGSVKNLSSN